MKILSATFTASLLLLMSSSAIAVKPVPYGPIDQYTLIDPWIDCSMFPPMDHTIGLEWLGADTGLMHFDQDGNLVKLNGFVETVFARSWNDVNDTMINSDSGDTAGRAERKHYTVLFDETGQDVLYKETAIMMKIVLPGYGQIAVNSGMATWVFDDTLDPPGWVVDKITPNYSTSEDDLYALCYYHGQ